MAVSLLPIVHCGNKSVGYKDAGTTPTILFMIRLLGVYKHTMRKRAGLLIAFAILAVPVFFFLSVIYSTRQRMSEFRTRIQPGMSVAELVRFAGKPTMIVHQGESLGAATHSFLNLSRDHHTVIYLYSKEGLPYYNVFVFIDERRNVVTTSIIK